VLSLCCSIYLKEHSKATEYDEDDYPTDEALSTQMSDQSSDMGGDEIFHRGRRSKNRKRRGPWEIHYSYEWFQQKTRTGVWKTYSDEELARSNCAKLNRQYSPIWNFTVVYNKDKEINGS